MLSVPSGANYRFTIINSSSTRKDLDWPVPNDLNDGYHQLVGTYDGVIGWAAFVWIAAIGVAFAILQNQSSESSSRDS